MLQFAHLTEDKVIQGTYPHQVLSNHEPWVSESITQRRKGHIHLPPVVLKVLLGARRNLGNDP